jgi:ribosomal-protein-alanine N-acetyltransferase
VTIELRAIRPDADPIALAQDLAGGFGGDAEPARELLEQTLGLLIRDPRPHPWGCYLARSAGETVGTCAFKTAPDGMNRVELAYMTFPAFEGRGHATAMVTSLLGIALTGGAATAVAHTLPEENASSRALRRNGFTFAGEVVDSEDGLVWRWERLLDPVR